MKVLVANRGEIAVRVIRACREMGWSSVAVYSDCDRNALHVRLADEACHLGGNPASESYLRIDKLVAAAVRTGATFVHPGYGFLAENPRFAEACADAGLTFVGPQAGVIRTMGSKTLARDAARRAGVPVVPGADSALLEDAPDAAVLAAAEATGYPLMVKAVAGGGGKGMRAVAAASGLLSAVRVARSEARAAFGDGAIYLERRLLAPRHIEIQVLGDAYGTVRAFVERDCSVQRRHQKVVEESPSTVVTEELRRELAAASERLIRAVGYTNAGTLEFLLDESGSFYFLEMNTRLQVEHPVTEMVTGVDLVQWQLRIARGDRLTVAAEDALTPRGHAIECRVYAEDPDEGFMPAPGVVRAIVTPGGPGIRDDRGVAAGFEVPVYYDSLISKLIVWGETRETAIARLTRALDEYRITGVRTTLPFFQWLVEQPAFREGGLTTTYLDEILRTRDGKPFMPAGDMEIRDALIAAALSAWLRTQNDTMARAPAADAWRQAARRESRR